MLWALLWFAAACDAYTRPTTATRVAISVDSVLAIGQTVNAQAAAYDSAGAPIASAHVQWEARFAFPWSVPDTARSIPLVVALDSVRGTLRALRPGHVWLVARSDNARDSVLVHVEGTLSVPINWQMATNDTVELAPGAGFAVGTYLRSPTGDQSLDDVAATGLIPDWTGRWSSSDPAVATWTPYLGYRNTGTAYTLVEMTAHGPGLAIMSVEYGGQRAAFPLRVRDPGPLSMDELGRCGLNSTGELWCQGGNDSGDLATYTATVCSRACSQVGVNGFIHGARGLRFSVITAATFSQYYPHWCGISLADARAYCWGYNHTAPFNYPPPPSTQNILAGPAGSSYCPEAHTSYGYAQDSCSFVPLAVDRMLDRPLIFRTIRATGLITCGTTGAPGAPEELWCWGDTAIPTLRTSYPAGWPTTPPVG